MFCGQCGKQIEENSRFCRFCGSKQADSDQLPEQPALNNPTGNRDIQNHDINKSKASLPLLVSIAMIIFIVVLFSFSKPKIQSDFLQNNVVASTNIEQPSDNEYKSHNEKISNWLYSTGEDKIRGSTTYYAKTVSTNQIHQSPPYDGGTSMSVTIRKHPAWGTDVILSITEGQMMCPSYEGCHGTVRFDNGPAQSISFNGPDDGSSETIFVV